MELLFEFTFLKIFNHIVYSKLKLENEPFKNDRNSKFTADFYYLICRNIAFDFLKNINFLIIVF
jgi:hypothetical protein